MFNNQASEPSTQKPSPAPLSLSKEVMAFSAPPTSQAAKITYLTILQGVASLRGLTFATYGEILSDVICRREEFAPYRKRLKEMRVEEDRVDEAKGLWKKMISLGEVKESSRFSYRGRARISRALTKLEEQDLIAIHSHGFWSAGVPGDGGPHYEMWLTCKITERGKAILALARPGSELTK